MLCASRKQILLLPWDQGNMVTISDELSQGDVRYLCPGKELFSKIVAISNFCRKVIVTIFVFYCTGIGKKMSLRFRDSTSCPPPAANASSGNGQKG